MITIAFQLGLFYVVEQFNEIGISLTRSYAKTAVLYWLLFSKSSSFEYNIHQHLSMLIWIGRFVPIIPNIAMSLSHPSLSDPIRMIYRNIYIYHLLSYGQMVERLLSSFKMFCFRIYNNHYTLSLRGGLEKNWEILERMPTPCFFSTILPFSSVYFLCLSMALCSS